MQKFLVLVLFVCVTAHCAETTLDDFFLALKQVETGTKEDGVNKLGDNGKALGPLQIHECCWKDSGVKFEYKECGKLNESKQVAIGYWKRYCNKAFEQKDWETLARVWNGGPKGATKKTTEKYWENIRNKIVEIRTKKVEKK